MLSDSLSVLTSITNLKCNHILLKDVFNLYSTCICGSKDIIFAWVPGHAGSRGNAVAAKHAPEKSVNKRLAVPYSVYNVLTNMYTKKLWRKDWGKYPENKL